MGSFNALGKVFNLNRRLDNRLASRIFRKANDIRVEEIRRFPGSFRMGSCSYDRETGVIRCFLPRDIREAAKAHPDPPVGRQMIGYLLTALAAVGYVGVLFLLGADGIRRGYGFWLLLGRYMLFLYGYKLFDILSTFEATKKWTMQIHNWGRIYGELSIMYEGRLPD